jgi:hypothetical protein
LVRIGVDGVERRAFAFSHAEHILRGKLSDGMALDRPHAKAAGA